MYALVCALITLARAVRARACVSVDGGTAPRRYGLAWNTLVLRASGSLDMHVRNHGSGDEIWPRGEFRCQPEFRCVSSVLAALSRGTMLIADPGRLSGFAFRLAVSILSASEDEKAGRGKLVL